MLAVLSYGHTVESEFVYDTRLDIEDVGGFLPWPNLRHLVGPRYFEFSHEVSYRPVRTITYLIDLTLWGNRAAGWHLSNVIQHGIAAMLVFMLLRRVAARPSLAFIAAALFAVHPIAQRPVCNVNGRADTLVTIWLLAAMLCHMAGRSQVKRSVWASLCFLAAMMSKDTGVVFPVLAVACDVALMGRRAWKQRWAYAAYGAVLVVFVVIRVWAFPGIVTDAILGAKRSPDVSVARTLLCYAGWFVLPWRIHPGPAWALPAVYRWTTAMQAAGLLAAGVIAWLLWARRNKTAAWALAWVAVTLLPVSNLVPMPRTPDSRFMYTAMVGWCALVAAACSQARRSWPAPALVLVLAFASLADHARWSADSVLWPATVREYPNSTTARNTLARLLEKSGARYRAIRQYEAECRAASGRRNATLAMANYYLRLGFLPEAIATSRRLINLKQDDADAWMCMGIAFAWSGRTDEAIEALRAATKMDPQFGAAWHNLAKALRLAGRRKEAEQAEQHAVDIGRRRK